MGLKLKIFTTKKTKLNCKDFTIQYGKKHHKKTVIFSNLNKQYKFSSQKKSIKCEVKTVILIQSFKLNIKIKID